MRKVSKLVREYITDEIRKRLYPKYKEQAELCQTQRNEYNEYLREGEKKLRALAEELKAEFLATHPNYTDITWWADFQDALAVEVKKGSPLDKASLWKLKFDDAVNNQFRIIVRDLEFGASKDDLEKFLNEL